MTDTTTLIQRLRTDVLWYRRRGNETIAEDCRQAADALEQQAAQIAEKDAEIAADKRNQQAYLDTLADAQAQIEALRADAERMRALLESSLRYLNDPALMKDELTGRRRDETRQEYADRLSDWIQENEDLRLLQEDIDAALRQEQPAGEQPT